MGWDIVGNLPLGAVVPRALAVVGLSLVLASCGPPDGPAHCATPGYELCNGIDDDCDGRTDNDVMTSQAEVCNGLDDDCNGRTDDGIVPTVEVCNRIDDDCDGLTDEDVAVGAEICHWLDDECDGTIDEEVFGVVSGPWPVGESEVGGNLMSAAWLPDAVGVVTGYTAYDSRGWYRIVSLSEGILAGGDIPYGVNGICTVRLGEELRILVVTPPVEWGEWDSQQILMQRVDLDGTLGAPVRIPFDFLPFAATYPCHAVAFGDGFILRLEQYPDQLLHVSAGGDVLHVWPLIDQAAQLVPTGDGSWLIPVGDEAGVRGVLVPGSTGDPFGGPLGVSAGALEGSTSVTLGFPASSVVTVSAPDAGRFAYHARTPANDGSPPAGPPWTVRIIEFSRVEDRFVLDDWRVVTTDGELSIGATNLGTYVFFGESGAGPDRPADNSFWHVADIVRFTTSAGPTGTVSLSEASLQSYMQLEPTQLLGGRTAVVYDVAEGRTEHLRLVVVGCLEGP